MKRLILLLVPVLLLCSCSHKVYRASPTEEYIAEYRSYDDVYDKGFEDGYDTAKEAAVYEDYKTEEILNYYENILDAFNIPNYDLVYHPELYRCYYDKETNMVHKDYFCKHNHSHKLVEDTFGDKAAHCLCCETEDFVYFEKENEGYSEIINMLPNAYDPYSDAEYPDYKFSIPHFTTEDHAIANGLKKIEY